MTISDKRRHLLQLYRAQNLSRGIKCTYGFFSSLTVPDYDSLAFVSFQNITATFKTPVNVDYSSVFSQFRPNPGFEFKARHKP